MFYFASSFFLYACLGSVAELCLLLRIITFFLSFWISKNDVMHDIENKRETQKLLIVVSFQIFFLKAVYIPRRDFRVD